MGHYSRTMRFLKLITLTVIVTSCSPTNKQKGLFDNLTNKETVVLFLSKYDLDGVPKDIEQLTNVKRLFISADSGAWTIYPPLSALPQPTDNTLNERLPNEITKLTNLKYLGLVRLNLTTLPDDFGKLNNLDSLDISFNRLTISNEIEKLKELKELKYLELTGNVVDSTDIIKLKKENPSLKIKTWIE